jgi:microcystin-dependent protein
VDPFIGEIRMFSFNFVPKYWAQCNGQLLSIQQNLALFSLLGTQFGGNGSTTFGLPDLRERVPVASGRAYPQGQPGGEAAHTLTWPELAKHSHDVVASTADGQANPSTTSRLAKATVPFYGPSTANNQPMNASCISNTGGGPHENMAPSLVVNYCIAMTGIFPSRP